MGKVFLSHNSADKAYVMDLKRKLESRLPDCPIWMDVEQLDPGSSLAARLNAGLDEYEVAVVFIGTSGVGPWQTAEIDFIVNRAIERQERLVVVLLPGALVAELPPLLSRYRRVQFQTHLDELLAIDDLCFGITGVDPATTPAVSGVAGEGDEAAMEEAVSALSELMTGSKNVTVFIGPGASPFGKEYPVRSSDVAHDLLRELKLIGEGEQTLLPPIDVAGSYFAVKRGGDMLEGRVIRLVSGRPTQIPNTHSLLAELFALLKRRPRTRIASQTRQLIVTTNLDLMIERALLRARIPFTRIVQYRGESKVQRNVYAAVERLADGALELRSGTVGVPDGRESVHTFRREDVAAMDDAISGCGSSTLIMNQGTAGSSTGTALTLDGLPEPVLYKLRGSVDVEGSCMLTTDQYLDFLRLTVKGGGMPTVIQGIASTTPAVFLGYGLLEPEFRLIWHSLPQGIESTRRYAIESSPKVDKGDAYRRVDEAMWAEVRQERLKRFQLTTIEASSEQFLSHWVRGLGRRLGAG
jgi:hypothetical protein